MTETENKLPPGAEAEIVFRDPASGEELLRYKVTKEEAIEFANHMERIGANMLTTEEAAKKANVKPTTIRKAIERGQLKADYFGAQRKIRESDLRVWMSTKRTPGRPSKVNG